MINRKILFESIRHKVYNLKKQYAEHGEIFER